MQALNSSRFDRARLRPYLLLAIVFFVAGLVSISMSRMGDGIAGVWFANAIVVGVALRQPQLAMLPACLAIIVGSLAANLSGGSSFGIAALFTLANVGSVFLSLQLTRGRLPCPAAESTGVRDLLSILGLAGGVTTILGAIIFALPAALLLQWPLLPTMWSWLVANALGFAIALPVVLFATRKALVELSDPFRCIQLAAIALSCALVACLAAVAGSFPFALAMLPLMLVAPRLPGFQLAAVCALTGAALMVVAMAGFVPGVREGIGAFRDGFQISVALTVLLPLMGGLLIRQIDSDRSRIAESEERFRRAMDDSPIGVAIATLDGKFVETNPAFAQMLGYDSVTLDTRTLRQIAHPEEWPGVAAMLLGVREAEHGSCRAEVRFLRTDGTPLWVQLSGSVIRDQRDGTPLYLVCQIEDVDARKKSDSRIFEAETRWNFALASAGQGVWDLDLRKGRSYYSPDWKKMLGYDDHEFGDSPELWINLVHPEDRERVAEADRLHMTNMTPFFEAEFRMRHKSGRWIWVLDRGKALERDADGRAIRAIGTHTDITRLKEAEHSIAKVAEQLSDEKERLRVTLNSIGDAVICVDAEGRVTFMNPVAEKLTRVVARDAQGRHIDEAYVAIDEETGEKLTACGNQLDHNARAVLLRRDGSVCSIRQVVSPIAAEGGRAGSVIVFQDFSDARSLQRELTYAASHDALTGLANRAAFLREMEAIVDSAAGDGPHQHFLFIDLDHFKNVNDTSGHAAGDALLRKVGETIGRVVGRDHLLARLGGDEFAVILRPGTRQAAEAAANRIVEAIRTIVFGWKGRVHRIGASIGISPVCRDAGSMEDVVALADEACYAAKAAGRGRAVLRLPAARPQPDRRLA